MTPNQPLASKRLLSLDTFRGITIMGMILVNNPGTWSAMYGPLKHADWHGWTPTDLIFPFFLFIVGVAIVFASPESWRRVKTAAVADQGAQAIGGALSAGAYPGFVPFLSAGTLIRVA